MTRPGRQDAVDFLYGGGVGFAEDTDMAEIFVDAVYPIIAAAVLRDLIPGMPAVLVPALRTIADAYERGDKT